MKAFHTIAVPHKDILEGRLTMDVFAADLWEVSQNRGPDEYKDAVTFFKKTYMTQGLENLLQTVGKRLSGKGGEPVIQIQTPFGGGKTHALIAMYHRAAKWNAKKAVVVGTVLGEKDTLWGLIEKQLTGKTTKLSSKVSPGKEAIRGLLAENQPVLILVDEVLEYVTKAAGVRVEESNLAAQTIAFMHELTEVASTLEKVCLVVTLPSSLIEHYDESAERLYQQLQTVSGRTEKIYTPVQESEITNIIRRRLFSDLNENEARKVVESFMEYAEREEIIPTGLEPSEYRDRFLNSYPFTPEVVDTLYHRWGSFPTFQRTRGVLRLLSLVIHSLKSEDKSYISLADFDLADQEIRQELLKHIGAEFNSVIAADITDAEAGSKKVNLSLGSAYQGLNLGSRAAVTVFLYSFSGGEERGTTLPEIKRSATTVENPSSVISEATEQLKGKLFYLQSRGDKYFFSNQPNINRIKLTKTENIKAKDLIEFERRLLGNRIEKGKLKTFIWVEDTHSIPDSEQLKLIILKEKNEETIKKIIKTKGKAQSTRVYQNTLFFLYPMETERPSFINIVKNKIAYENILKDKDLRLSDEQRNDIKRELKNITTDLEEYIRKVYRMVAIPSKDGFKEIDLGIPTYGEEKGLDQEVYEKLRSDGEILEKIAPIVIKEKYLSGKNDYISTEQLYQSSLKTPGKTRPVNKEVLEKGIVEGVRKGLFGLGELENDKPNPRYFKEDSSVAFSGSEIILDETLCKEPQGPKEPPQPPPGAEPEPPKTEEEVGVTPPIPSEEMREHVHLKLQVPKGKLSRIMGVLNLLQSKFDTVKLEFSAEDGAISEQDYEDKVEDTFRQLEIEFDEE